MLSITFYESREVSRGENREGPAGPPAYFKRAEANAVSIYEYNEEEHMRMEREDAFADGLQEGVRRERINTERERLRAEEEKRRAEEEKQRVQEEKLRADQAEAEVLRLKEELAKMSKRK